MTPQISAAVTIVLLLLGGCGKPQSNPSFDLSTSRARQALETMEADPKPLERPLVILGGFSDPIGASLFRGRCDDFFDDRRIIAISFIGVTSFEQCRQRVIESVDRAFPTDDPVQTTEVDVIGLSMGGLVARLSAEPIEREATGAGNGGASDDFTRRLRIARLFTVASPLRGAKLAEFPLVLTPMHRDMRVGSQLLERLNATPPSFPIYSYTRLRDRTVGEHLTSPEGQDPWWLDVSPFEGAHIGAALDRRILADIVRRLRGEEPFTTDPPAPLPATARR